MVLLLAPVLISIPRTVLGIALVPVALVPILFPQTTLLDTPEPPRRIPFIPLPEIRLPLPIVLDVAPKAMLTPWRRFFIAADPSAFTPIRLFWIWLLLVPAPAIVTPFSVLPEITFSSPAVAPPTMLPDAPDSIVMPSAPLGRALAPDALTPM